MGIRSFYSVINIKAQEADIAKKNSNKKSQPGQSSSFKECKEIEKDEVEYEYDNAKIISDHDVSSFQIEVASTTSQSNIQLSAYEEDFSDTELPQSAQTSTIDKKAKLQRPDDMSQCATRGPRQPVIKKYSQTKTRTRFRAIRPQWFQSFEWLEYSKMQHTISLAFF
ncbi:Hypothetical predicted protein [Pelobates cultripes]|uniref:Uncharacterized protein n=1 Tax=Pelobates cultripes TaxID=61616 RepID=A0AAD1S254_PELCU|nr:Hypothetical predicted protein [Pelobates cultripes]